MMVVLLIVGAIAVVRIIAAERERAAKRRRMRAAPREIVDSALVTLTGTVKLHGEPLDAPLSGKRCVAFRVSVRLYEQTSRRRRRLLEHKFAAAMTPFTLVTDHGDVLVDGSTCDLLLRPAPVIPRKIERDERLMARLDIRGSAADAGFDEALVAEGATIAVHGIAREEVAADGAGETGFREAPRRIRLTGDDTHPLTIDRP
jgi:hypothetical protein